MDRFEEFLGAVIPREKSVGGTVDVRVTRALAWYIASRPGGDQAPADLEAYAVELEKLGCPDLAYSPAAAFVRDAIAFVRDEQRQSAVLRRVMDGQPAVEAVRDVFNAA